MFKNVSGEFADLSLESGIDFLEDGRGFVICDLDKDGKPELGIVSARSPRFRIASLNVPNAANSVVEVRLVGGNHSSSPSSKLSPRDPIGAVVVAKTGDNSRMFQLSSGEGFSVQNSRSISIGLGELTEIEELEIRWPSGKVTVKKKTPAGSSIEILEDQRDNRHVSESDEKG